MANKLAYLSLNREKLPNIFIIGARGFPNIQGGIETHCEGLYQRIDKKRYKITALTIKQYTKKDFWQGIYFIKIPSIGLKYFQKPIYNMIAALYCIFKKPDIIHIHGLNGGFFIWLFKIFRLKVVATYHSRDYLYPKWNLFAKFILKLCEKQFMLADYIITISNNYLIHFKNMGRSSNINYIPNGVDLPDRSKYEGRTSFLNRWGLKKNSYILTVGRITPEKNYETVIKAFKIANLNGINLVIVGEQDFQKNYYKYLKKLANENVIFTGRLNKMDVYTLYANCIIFVLASIYEGLPNSLLEALSFNCNVLISDINAHIEIGLSPDNYFKVKNEFDLANKLKLKVYSKKKEDFSDFIIKKYHWENISNKIMLIYEMLLNR